MPSLATLDDEHIPYTTLDFLYESSRNYDSLAEKIAREVRRRGKDKNVCYCIDGCAAEDEAARLLLKHRVTLIDGRSKAAHFASAAKLNGEYSAYSAFSPVRPVSLPAVFYDVTADNLSDWKLSLAEQFGDEVPVCLISEHSAEKMPLFEADRRKDFGNLSGLVVYDVPLLEKKKYDFEDLLAIMRRLRAPDGCPWDRVQTHESIRINAIEEAYELVDAIDKSDPDKICEETGDVLMQAVFHALMEEEKGTFSVGDMVTTLCEKLITRHTHIFGGDHAENAEGALSVWEKNKMTEKHQTTYSDAVRDVPAVFPALLRAQKVAKRMEKGGWDKATIENFERKFREEYIELKEAMKGGDKARIFEELGDVLFCTVELGRAMGIDCEMALLDTVKKCSNRYCLYESLVLADGKDVHSLTDEEKEFYYRKAKDAARA